MELVIIIKDSTVIMGLLKLNLFRFKEIMLKFEGAEGGEAKVR